MAVTTFPTIPRLCSLVDLQIHQVALKNFHYHTTAVFPYNLLIATLDAKGGADDYLMNTITGEKTHLRAGYAYILPCHVPIQFERTPAFTVVTIRFNLTFFYALDIFHGSERIGTVRAPEFISFLKNTVCSSGQVDLVKTATRLKIEIMGLCLSCWPDHVDQPDPRMWKYEKILLYVRMHGDANLTVDQLARQCGMRQDVFSRSFSRDLGRSPSQYIADFLVQKISTYLLTSRLSLKEIAQKLNFSSEYYLSRFFKKHTKLSPRDFKKQFFG